MTDPDALLRDVEVAAIDVETTGLRPDARIVEVAVVIVPVVGPPRLALRERVNPAGVEITEGATRAHGLRAEDLADAPPWGEVWPRVVAAVGERPLLAYSAPSDYGWLRGHVGDGWPEGDGWAWPWLDAHPLVEVADRYATGKSLGDACKRRGILVDAHGAAGDAVALGLLWRRLMAERVAPSNSAWSSARQDLQAIALWREQDFAAYVRRKHGTRGERPRCPWHDLAGLERPYWPEHQLTGAACVVCAAPGVVYAVQRDGSVHLTNVADGGTHLCVIREPEPEPDDWDSAEAPDDDPNPDHYHYGDQDIPF